MMQYIDDLENKLRVLESQNEDLYERLKNKTEVN